MENIALSIGTALFEKLGNYSEAYLKSFLLGIFTSLNFYRNYTK